MNLRFSNYNKKNIFSWGGLLCVVLFISSLTFAFRTPVLAGLKFPLIILNALRQEIKALVFFHRDFYENAALRKEIDYLKNKLNQAQEAHLENTRLASILSFKQNSPYRVNAARVIGFSPDSWSSAILIDRGRLNGIKRGSAVITYLGLVGRVVEVQAATSKALCINDPQMGVSATVQRSRQQGLVSGTLGNFLVMKYLSADADIKPDDLVITSGLSEAYPKGLLIGRVVEVRAESSGFGRYALIRPAVALGNLEEVLVVASW